jgi:CRISPR-associated protein Csb2
MAFAIVAEMPLGTYRGNGQDGRPERLPSVARLHSALLSAAGFGPRAVPSDRKDWCPNDDDAAALTWLEENPPDGVRIPALEFGGGRVIAYRDDGTIKKSKDQKSIKKFGKHPEAGAAVGGRFIWTWREPPPESVRDALDALCPDVPYLGTSESPVRLTAVQYTDDDGELEATHVLDLEAGMFDTATTGIDRPLPGRLKELTDAHAAANGAPPSASRDKVGTDEKSHSMVPPRRRVESARYRARQAVHADVPWSRAVLLPLEPTEKLDSGYIQERDRVRWAVAAHRALIRLIGDGAPSLITGAYPKGSLRPANRLSLQLLDPQMPVRDGAAVGPATLAVLVPRGADAADLDALFGALARLKILYGSGGRTFRVEGGATQVLDGDAFWRPPATGFVRLWRTAPAAVPDTRGARGPAWTFAHAALLSVAFAWKDHLPKAPGRGDDYQRAMAAGAAQRGAAVVHVSAVRGSDVGRYVHRVNADAVVRPYVATLTIGDLAGPGTVQAIGQSRHLGGGLLVPFDVRVSGGHR